MSEGKSRDARAKVSEMSTPETDAKQSLHLRRTAIILAAGWSAAVSLVFGWHLSSVYTHVQESAQIQAASLFEKDVVYRHWAANHGGVYVPPTADTPPNPYLSHLKRRDVTTTSGQELTLVNPAYMTREVHELGRKHYGHQSHITSLNPLRPENAPDPWETKALRAIEQGRDKVVERIEFDGADYTRLMRPLITKASCLKCHAEQGYKVGDVRGGISVSVPMEPLWASTHRYVVALAAGYLLIWLLGLLGIGMSTRHTRARIQERIQSAMDLRESEERFRAIFETSRDAIMTLEPPAWLFTSGNPATVRMFRADDEQDFLAHEPWALSPEYQPDGRISADKAREMIETAMNRGTHFFEWTHTRTNGEAFPATVLLTRMQIGGQTLLQATVRDITPQKQAEAEREAFESELRQRQKMTAVGTLARGAAHEINNPIMGIMNYAELIKDRLDPAGDLTEFAEGIISETERIASITQGLLTFASAERKTPHVAVEVSKLVTSALDRLRAALKHDQVVVNVDMGTDLPEVSCNPEKIRDVVAELIANARDALNERYPAADADKRLFIQAELLAPSAMVRITVEDRGVGISEAHCGRIFEPFFTTKDKAVGAGSIGKGMGLFISYAIVQAHEGNLSAESELGQWTRVHVDLPAAATQKEA